MRWTAESKLMTILRRTAHIEITRRRGKQTGKWNVSFHVMKMNQVSNVSNVLKSDLAFDLMVKRNKCPLEAIEVAHPLLVIK